MRRPVASLVALPVLVALVTSGCAMLVNTSKLPASSDTLGAYGAPAISANGRYVVYAAHLDPRFPGIEFGIYLKDAVTGTIELISQSTTGEVADGWSGEPAISSDGRYVSFSSDAENLVANDENQSTDVFVRDRTAKTTTRVSVASDGSEPDDSSYNSSISDDGRYVAFLSDSDFVVDDDLNVSTDAFVRDRVANTTRRIDVTSAGEEIENGASEVRISGNGRYVLFTTDSDMPSDLNFSDDVYRRDLQLNRTARVSNTTDGGWGGYPSADGRWVAFTTTGKILAADTNGYPDVYLVDVDGTTRYLVSAGPAGTTIANGISFDPSVSADGRYVSFQSNANITGTDSNGATVDVFVRDVQTARTVIGGTDLFLNVPSAGSTTGRISGDGRNLAFGSTAKINSDDQNTVRDIYERSLVIPEITNVTPTTVARGVPTTLTVTGRNFLAGARARVGGTDATSVTVNSETSLTLQVTLPSNATTGKVDLYVNNLGTGTGPNGGTVGKCALCVTVQ